MELNQLQYFRTVARTENISKSADILHISQSALSKSITRLEAEVGVPLFERSGNRIRLSQAGILFLGRVDQAMAQIRGGLDELRNIQAGESGAIHFASFSSGLVTEPLRAFLSEYPNISVRHSVLSQRQIQVGLEQGDIDIALALFPINSPILSWTPVAQDELIILVSDNNLIAKYNSVRLTDLVNQTLALPDPNLGLRTLLEGFCARSGFVPRICYEGNDSDMVMSMVRDNACVFVVPASIHIWKVLSDQERRAKGERLQFRRPFPFSSVRIAEPVCSFSYGLCISKEKILSRGANILLQMILDYFDRWNSVRESDEYERLLHM